MHILALDVGEKKIGLAIGDTTTKMAFTRPALLVDSWDQVWGPLRAFLRGEQIERIVIGWPINIDGTLGPQSARVQEFIDQLQDRTNLEIIKRDERQTSIAVQREQQAAGRHLKRGEEDSLAAQLLLESYLMEHHD